MSSSIITAPSAPASGLIVEVRRQTPLNRRVVSFSDHSILKATDLNLADTQWLYILQELYDKAGEVLAYDRHLNAFSASGRRIVNIGDAVDPTDAVSMRSMQLTIAEVRQELLAYFAQLRASIIAELTEAFNLKLANELTALRIYLLNSIDTVKNLLQSEIASLRNYTTQEIALLRGELRTITNALEASFTTKLANQKQEIALLRGELHTITKALEASFTTKLANQKQEITTSLTSLIMSEITAQRSLTLQEVATLRNELRTTAATLNSSMTTALALQRQECLDNLAAFKTDVQNRYDSKLATLEVNMSYLWTLINEGTTPVAPGLTGFHTIKVDSVSMTAYNYMPPAGTPPFSVPFNTFLVNGVSITSQLTSPFHTIKVHDVLIQA